MDVITGISYGLLEFTMLCFSLWFFIIYIFNIIGYLCGQEGYYDHSHCSNKPHSPSYCGYDFRDNEKPIHDVIGQYSANLFSEKAVNLINEHEDNKVIDSSQCHYSFMIYHGK